MSKIGVPLIKLFLKNSEDMNPGIGGIAKSKQMWIEHSTFVSIKDARMVAKQLATRFGSETIMIVQVIDTDGEINVI